jgi:hypothetical protein
MAGCGPARDQKGQQTQAFPPIRLMQPRPHRQRCPPIPRHQQLQASLPGQPGHWPKQARRQAARHHACSARQR